LIFINVLGLSLIALIVWWFWLYKPADIDLGENDLVIVVENGIYQPAHIKLPANQPATLQILRKDASPCAETLLIPDLEFSESLPLNKLKIIQLPAMAPGEYTFHCQMQMYRGTLVVN
jgi:plastocyanin domain-containing protein